MGIKCFPKPFYTHVRIRELYSVYWLYHKNKMKK